MVAGPTLANEACETSVDITKSKVVITQAMTSEKDMQGIITPEQSTGASIISSSLSLYNFTIKSIAGTSKTATFLSQVSGKKIITSGLSGQTGTMHWATFDASGTKFVDRDTEDPLIALFTEAETNNKATYYAYIEDGVLQIDIEVSGDKITSFVVYYDEKSPYEHIETGVVFTLEDQ